jgi:hypothetical protein
MANLLYPVDMSSFVGPDKDAKFRDLIIILQKQMGVQPTGILTNAQYDRLVSAAKDVDGSGVQLLSHKNVSVERDLAFAAGTLAGGDISQFNAIQLICSRQTGTCDQAIASLDLQYLTLSAPITYDYEIKTWTTNTVVAVTQSSRCSVETMTLDAPTQTLTITSTGSCANKSLATYTLIDGSAFSLTFSRNKALQARELVYEPARKFLPHQSQ